MKANAFIKLTEDIEIEPMKEQSISKRFFIRMADEIRSMSDTISKKDLVDRLCVIFKEENPQFDSGRFRSAVGI